MLRERDMCLMKRFAARRVRADVSRKAGVKDGGGLPGSNTMKGRSMDDDEHCGCRASHKGET
jgi:hypothetical protein